MSQAVTHLFAHGGKQKTVAGGIKRRETWGCHGVPGGIVAVPVCGIGDIMKTRTAGRAYGSLAEREVKCIVRGLGYENGGIQRVVFAIEEVGDGVARSAGVWEHGTLGSTYEEGDQVKLTIHGVKLQKGQGSCSEVHWFVCLDVNVKKWGRMGQNEPNMIMSIVVMKDSDER